MSKLLCDKKQSNGSAISKKNEEIRELVYFYNGITIKYKVKKHSSNFFN